MKKFFLLACFLILGTVLQAQVPFIFFYSSHDSLVYGTPTNVDSTFVEAEDFTTLNGSVIYVVNTALSNDTAVTTVGSPRSIDHVLPHAIDNITVRLKTTLSGSQLFIGIQDTTVINQVIGVTNGFVSFDYQVAADSGDVFEITDVGESADIDYVIFYNNFRSPILNRFTIEENADIGTLITVLPDSVGTNVTSTSVSQFFTISNDSLFSNVSFDYEDNVRGNTFILSFINQLNSSDTLRYRVNVTDLTDKYDQNGLADADIAAKYSQVEVGDYIFFNADTSNNISFTSGPMGLSPGAHIKLHGKDYGSISIGMSTDSGTVANPIVITNFLGQVQCESLTLQDSVINVTITGKFNSTDRTGHTNFKGHVDGYAYSAEKYGIYIKCIGNNCLDGLSINNGLIRNLEISYVEAHTDGSSAFDLKWDDNYSFGGPIYIHNNYLHDLENEGIQIGSTSTNPQSVYDSVRIQDNRILRTGGNPLKLSRIRNVMVSNNVTHGGLDWPAPPANDDNSKWSLQFEGAGGTIEKNISISTSTGDLYTQIPFESSYYTSKPEITFSADSVLYNDNLNWMQRGNLSGRIPNQTSDVNLSWVFDDNFYGPMMDNGLLEQDSTPTTNPLTSKAILAIEDTANTGVYYVVRNNVVDTSYTLFDRDSNTTTLSGNTFSSSINTPDWIAYMTGCDQTTIGDDFDYRKIVRYTDSICGDYENPNWDNCGELKEWVTGDIVQWTNSSGETRFYLCVQGDDQPGNGPSQDDDNPNNAYWTMLTWNSGTSYLPPDNVRLTVDSYYEALGIGLNTPADAIDTTLSLLSAFFTHSWSADSVIDLEGNTYIDTLIDLSGDWNLGWWGDDPTETDRYDTAKEVNLLQVERITSRSSGTYLKINNSLDCRWAGNFGETHSGEMYQFTVLVSNEYFTDYENYNGGPLNIRDRGAGAYYEIGGVDDNGYSNGAIPDNKMLIIEVHQRPNGWSKMYVNGQEYDPNDSIQTNAIVDDYFQYGTNSHIASHNMYFNGVIFGSLTTQQHDSIYTLLTTKYDTSLYPIYPVFENLTVSFTSTDGTNQNYFYISGYDTTLFNGGAITGVEYKWAVTNNDRPANTNNIDHQEFIPGATNDTLFRDDYMDTKWFGTNNDGTSSTPPSGKRVTPHIRITDANGIVSDWIQAMTDVDATTGQPIPDSCATGPSVTITDPIDGATIVQNTVTPAEFTVSDNDGIDSVVFFINHVRQAVDVSVPYEYSLPVSTLGPYDFLIIAHDICGNTGGDTISYEVIEAPSVCVSPPTLSMTTPAISEGDTFTLDLDQVYQIEVAITDEDGVNNAKGYLDGVFQAQENLSPYNWTLPTSLGGTFRYTVKAFDDCPSGSQEDSIYFYYTVGVVACEAVPTVTITSPADGSSIYETVSTTATVTAVDADGIDSVVFFIDDVRQAVDVSSPYQYSLPVSTPATYEFKAVAWDTCSTSGADSINYTVLDLGSNCSAVPVVSISSPVLSEGDTLSLDLNEVSQVTISATDGDGISDVSLYKDFIFYSTDGAAPYTFTIPTTQAGTSRYTAIATDNCVLGSQVDSIYFYVTVSSTSTITLNGTDTSTTIAENTVYQNLGVLQGGTSPYRVDQLYGQGRFLRLRGDTVMNGVTFNYEAQYTSNQAPGNAEFRVYDANGSSQVFTIVVTDVSGTYDTNGEITQAVADSLNAMIGWNKFRAGDYHIVNASNLNIQFFDLYPTVASDTNNIYVSGFYRGGTINFDSIQGRDTSNQCIFSNGLGQFLYNNQLTLDEPKGIRFTGKYDPAIRAGDTGYAATVHDEWKHRRFGWYRNAFQDYRVTPTFKGVEVNGYFQDIEFDHMELCGGAYAGFDIKEDDPKATNGVTDTLYASHNVWVHDVYFHEVGESVYLGNTKSYPQHFFKNAKLYNLLSTRNNYETWQAQRGIGEFEARNIIGVCTGRWRDPFQNLQGGLFQVTPVEPVSFILEDMIYLGGGGNGANLYKPYVGEMQDGIDGGIINLGDTIFSTAADSVLFKNILFYRNRNEFTTYSNGLGGRADFSTPKFRSVFSGHLVNNWPEVDTAFDYVTQVVDFYNSDNVPWLVVMDSIRIDNTIEALTAESEVTATNTIVGTVTKPVFENPWGTANLTPACSTKLYNVFGGSANWVGFDIDSIHNTEVWVQTVFGTSASSPSDFCLNCEVQYNQHDIVGDWADFSEPFEGNVDIFKMYYCIQSHGANTTRPKDDTDESHWVELTWIDNRGIYQEVPPDDWNTQPGSFYQLRGMGLIDPNQATYAPNYPGGRIALIHDGNAADSDDHGALPLMFMQAYYAGVMDSIVVCLYSNLTQANTTSYVTNGLGTFSDWNEIMNVAVDFCVNSLGADSTIFYNVKEERTSTGTDAVATAALTAAIDASSATSPLWILQAAPSHQTYNAIANADPTKLQYVHIISHSGWNEYSVAGGAKNLDDVITDYGTHLGSYTLSCSRNPVPCLDDQNTTNGRNDFADEGITSGTPETGTTSTWDWMYSTNDGNAITDSIRKLNNDGYLKAVKSKIVDWSDAGMMYYLLDGGPINGGCKTCGTAEVQALFETGAMPD